MSKAKELLKRVDPLVAGIKIIMTLVACAAMILPCLYFIVQAQMAPVTRYIQGDIERVITKNAAKIEKDPQDVKTEDVEWALNWWPYLEQSDIINKQTLEQKVEILREWYRSKKV